MFCSLALLILQFSSLDELTWIKIIAIEPRTQSYKDNSSLEFDSTLEKSIWEAKIGHVTDLIGQIPA